MQRIRGAPIAKRATPRGSAPVWSILPSVQLDQREGAGEQSPVTGAKTGAVAEAEEVVKAEG